MTLKKLLERQKVNKSEYKNLIVGIFGELGCGKTLLLSLLGKYFYDLGYRIYANYHFALAHELITDLNQLKNIDIKYNSVFLFDELYVSADARQHGTEQNIELSKWILQSRKKKVSLFYTAQYIRLVEQRIRMITQILLKPEIVAYNIDNTPAYMLVDKYLRDITGYAYPQGKILVNLNLSEIVNLYDTSEIVTKVNIESKYDEIIKSFLEKYANAEKLKKRDITSILTFEYKLPLNRAMILSNYLLMKIKKQNDTL